MSWWVQEVDPEGQPLSAAEKAEQEAIIFVNALQQRLSAIDALLDALQFLGTATSPQTLGSLLALAEAQVGEAHGVLRQWLQHEREEAGGGASWRQLAVPAGEMAS
jgi:hypothetical protein